jgi:hypothetical protein
MSKLKTGVMMALALSFATASYAGPGTGTVVSVDPAKNQVIVDVNGSHETIMVTDAASIQNLQPGDKVQADSAKGWVQKQ